MHSLIWSSVIDGRLDDASVFGFEVFGFKAAYVRFLNTLCSTNVDCKDLKLFSVGFGSDCNFFETDR